jgi:hypothetical protein
VDEVGREESVVVEVLTSSRKEVNLRANVKAWRVKKTKPKVTLGRDVGMQEVGYILYGGL